MHAHRRVGLLFRSSGISHVSKLLPGNGMRKGSLTVVGTGIRLSQMTMEARLSIESADKVLYTVADAVTETAIKKLNSTAESLQPLYKPGKYCLVTYQEMVDRIL